jgi:TetR/AcrR family transcriptional regulator, cholesterol catabolism regulator
LDIQEKILNEAQRLFWRFGIKSVTMDDIAKMLGMSKKTIYQYFGDKNEIVCQITSTFLKKQDKDMEEIKNTSSDSIEEMFRISNYMKQMLESIHPSLLYDLKKYHPMAFNIFSEHKNTCFYESIVLNLQKGIAEGYYRSDINISVLAKLRMEQVEMGFNPEIFPLPEFRMQEVQLQLFDHFIHGITTLKGHKLLNRFLHVQEEEN